MTESKPLSGLFLLNKPAGVTSFDCVHLLKRELGASRVGHCGTLDPGARGLLILLVNQATKLQNTFLELEKTYWFRAQLGIKTATADLEGEIIEKRASDHVTREGLQNVLQSFTSEIFQTPPLYSALKYKGKPYYQYARKGQDVPRVPRPVTIYAFELLHTALPDWEARVRCSRGTYVRTLVEDVSVQLGTCGTMTELVREKVGPYTLDQALTIQEVRAMSRETLQSRIQPAETSVELLTHA